MDYCSKHLEFPTCDFDRILKTETARNGRIKNLDDFERDEADTYLWKAGLLNEKEKGMAIFYIMRRFYIMLYSSGETSSQS